MTIYNEMFKVRKDIQTVKKQINELVEESKKKGTPKIHAQIEELTQQLEHLKVRVCILEKLSGEYHH
ncbi:MAG: hypothetical protein AB1782_00825 [Cyanobacteriota bacterium]